MKILTEEDDDHQHQHQQQQQQQQQYQHGVHVVESEEESQHPSSSSLTYRLSYQDNIGIDAFSPVAYIIKIKMNVILHPQLRKTSITMMMMMMMSI
jgi:hypothetical protein